MSDRERLNPERFDMLTSGPEKLWGLSTIARAIGRSVDTTRTLAKSGLAPIYQPPGTNTYFAFRSELHDWLRTKAA